MEFCSFAICTILAFIPWISAEEKLLYQTPNENRWGSWDVITDGLSSLNWNYFPVPNHFTLCSSFLQEQKNWLRSPLIDVQSIDRVTVSVKYTINSFCSSQPSNRFCTDSIGVYVWESVSHVTTDLIPDPRTSNSSYREFATIRDPASDQTISLALQLTKRYIVLGFLDQGGCKILSSVRITYNICPLTKLRDVLVDLPETLAPSNALKSVQVGGLCTPNSFHIQGSLNVACESSGQWNVSQFKGKCVCKEDRENVGGTCRACSQGTYNDAKELNCTAIPSHPRNVVTLFVNQTSATVNWMPPNITGDQVFYEVKCQHTCEIDGKDCTEEICGSDNNTGFVFMNKSYGTTVTIPGTTGLLSPFVKYTCKIVAKNRVSEVAARKHKVEARSTTITFKTNGSVPGRPEVSAKQAEDGATVLSWRLKCKNGIIEKYMVTYFDVDDTSDHESLTTPETEQRIQKLNAGKTYEFQVTAVNNFGQGTPGVKRFTIPNNLSGLSFKTKTVIGGVVGGGGLLLIILVIIIIIFRFKRGNGRNKKADNMPLKERGRTYCHPTGQFNMDVIEKEEDDVNHVINHSPQYMEISEIQSFELKRDDVALKRLLGSGNFGEVYKATMGNDTVAVKSLKGSAANKDKQDMITELNVMKRLKPHPHVLKLIGCCSIGDPLLIVLEYLPYGDLLGYLRKSRGHSDSYNTGEKKPSSKLTAKDLLSFAWMIADGMQYLATMKVIHRDLAARNILVGENQVCKISDFGLARDVRDGIYMRASKARLPVKWMPPESIFHGECSTMSDVWSYGIVLWEVFTIGDSPYPRFKSREVPSLLERGYRMQRPIHISEELFSVLTECWAENAKERPSFHWICAAVKRLTKDQKAHVNLDEYNDEDYVNFDMIDETR
ncbi:hypothetical protein ABFA07_019499 [Porites harrisoni]